jgi:hypothetical protein
MKGLLGGILLGVGILIAGGSGLCSLVFVVVMLSGNGGSTSGMMPIVLLVGGIPFAIGIGLFYLGRWIIRSAAAETPPE